MKAVTFPHERCSWDRYKAFHTFCCMETDGFKSESDYGGVPTPLVLFDTGEVICTNPRPDPNQRSHYHSIGVSLTTTKDLSLWMPDGRKVTMAWLDDGGMQYLLHDHDTKHVVRIDGEYRRPPQVNYTGTVQPGSTLTPSIPLRFQHNARAYIPGTGLPPVSHSKIRVSIPVERAGYTSDELEHIHMIVATGQAAMKLTDHEALQRSTGTLGVNPDVLLKCKTWQDAPAAVLPALARTGAGRVVRDFDYLLADQE